MPNSQHAIEHILLEVGIMGGKMMKAILATLSVLACTTSTPAFAQFSPSDLREIEAQIGPAKDSVPQLVPPTPAPPRDLNSANGICEAAQQSFSKGTPLTLQMTNLSGLLDAAGKQLLRDSKDQFETVAEYEARQTARQNAWIGANRFFVLPLSLASGNNVYNAENQLYTLDAAGSRVKLTPEGRRFYSFSIGFESIIFPDNIPIMQGAMDQSAARIFYTNRNDYNIIYVANLMMPPAETISAYSKNQYNLRASVACRFVSRLNDQRVLYFAKP